MKRVSYLYLALFLLAQELCRLTLNDTTHRTVQRTVRRFLHQAKERING